MGNRVAPAGDREFDALLRSWLAERGPRIGVQIAAEFAKRTLPWELPGVHDSLHGVLQAKTFTVGSGDFFETAVASVGDEANEPGRTDPDVVGFFLLASLCTAACHVPSPLTVAFRQVAGGDDRERRWLLDVLEVTHSSLREFGVDASALAHVGRTAVREAVTGVFDDREVERVAEELDSVQPGWPVFMEGIRRKSSDRTQFIDALEAMLGERWKSPAWQMVRHVLVEPRRW